ncbi:carbohydrate ABC transporter permease [Oceanobacillus damuensis]|uniref:carbohydrate ABC transporter permease n=1 Tax=Oceanobacillus damuensis TaxID=937928 RepID=UPI00082A432E|nr:sugar ABC transporter permease [Oceanobacillus damuensis]
MRFKGNTIGYLFILPAVAVMATLVGYPIVYNIILSFQDVTLMNLGSGAKSFIGLDHYKQIFSDELFMKALWQTVYYSVASIILQFVIGFALALFFSLNFKLASYLRGLMMVTWLVPLTVAALLFQFMLSPSVGVLNYLPMELGILSEPIAWLSDTNYALWGLILTNVWIGIPFNMLLIATGINSLLKEVFESAQIDGANWFQRFVKITLPMLRPVLLIVLMLGMIYTFKVFDLVFVMTNGGPANSTEVLSTLSYRYSFDHFNFGLGASVANVLFLILLVIAFFYIKMTRDDEVIE